MYSTLFIYCKLNAVIFHSQLALNIARAQFQAQNPDELTIVENEQLEVVGEGDGKYWKIINYR